MKQLLALFIIISVCIESRAAQRETLHITGETCKGDTVTITLWDHYFGQGKIDYMPHRKIQKITEDGAFSFRFNNIKGPVYYTITVVGGWSRRARLQYYLALPGDSIHIRQSQYKYFSFSGAGAETAVCRYEIDSLAKQKHLMLSKQSNAAHFMLQNQPLLYLPAYYAGEDSVYSLVQQLLYAFRPRLQKTACEILQADYMGKHAQFISSYYSYAHLSPMSTKDPDSVVLIQGLLRKMYIVHEPNLQTSLSPAILSASMEYKRAAAMLARQHSLVYPGKTGVELIREKYTGSLRDGILTILLIDYTPGDTSYGSQFVSVTGMITTGLYKKALSLYRLRYLKGIPAYDFALPDVTGKIRRLSDFRGKKVVIDFWYTGCSGCTQLYVGALKEVEKRYAGDSSIVFLSISSDKNKSQWMESIRQDIYTSITCVNLITGTEGEKHPAWANYGVYGAPTMVVIDKYGKIIANQNPPRTVAGLVNFIQQQ